MCSVFIDLSLLCGHPTPAWLGEAYPLDVRIGAPALSRICWRSRLLSVSSFPESLDTHLVSANDSTRLLPHHRKFQDSVLCTSVTLSCEGWGSEAIGMRFRAPHMKGSENTRAGAHPRPRSQMLCEWKFEGAPGVLEACQALPHPPCAALLS